MVNSKWWITLHPLFSLHILIHICTMKVTYIYVFLEYNHVSHTNLKASFFGITFICQHTNLFNLETCSSTCCLITAQMVDIIFPQMTISASCYICKPPTCGKWAMLALVESLCPAQTINHTLQSNLR